MSEKNSSKVLITDETNLGNSYYLEDYLYDYLYDYFTDSYSSNYYYDDDYYYDDYYDSYYDNDYYYDDYYDSYYDDDYYYDDYYNSYYDDDYYYPFGYYSNYYPNRYWYDDYYYDNYHYDYEKKRLTVYGDTLRVGSDYDENIWLNDVSSGSYAKVRVIDDTKNSHNLFITGNSNSNSIYSGDGITTLWGAGGDSNTLIGGSKRNYFWYQGGSKDVVTKFSTGESPNSDILLLANGTTYSNIYRDSQSITFYMPDGNYIQIYPEGSPSDEDPILLSFNGLDIYRYKIAKNTSTNLTYRDDINAFCFSQPGQLIVNDTGHNIWLGGENGQNFANVSTINASASYGYNTLMGDSNSNVIIGGSGISTLWGGKGAATDILIGGTGSELFGAGRFEGNDIIYTNECHDLIFLYDTNLSDITSLNVTGDMVAVGLNSGTSLNVYNSAEVTSVFQLANGDRYNFNRSTQQWQNA